MRSHFNTPIALKLTVYHKLASYIDSLIHDKWRMLTPGPVKCLEVTLLSCNLHVLSAIPLLPRKAILIEPPHDMKMA